MCILKPNQFKLFSNILYLTLYAVLKSSWITFDDPLQQLSLNGVIASWMGQFLLAPACRFKSSTSFWFAANDGGFEIVNAGTDGRTFNNGSAVSDDTPSTMTTKVLLRSTKSVNNGSWDFPNLLMYDMALSLALPMLWYSDTPICWAKTSLASSGERVGGIGLFVDSRLGNI